MAMQGVSQPLQYRSHVLRMWTSYDKRFGRESKVYLSHPRHFLHTELLHQKEPTTRSQGCKEYCTANQLAKKCRKKKYDSIHDRFIRDKTFRKAMIEVGRSEQMIVEMDKLASEDHTYKASKKRLNSTVAIGGSTRMWHTLIQYPQGTNPNSKVRCQQCKA